MFTLFDLIQLMSPLVGAIIGGAVGGERGIAYGVLGALLGGFIGLKIGSLPTRLMIRSARNDFAPLSIPELEDKLVDTCWTPNLILMELKARGQDVDKHLPFVLSLLKHSHTHCRTKGYAALLSAFPDIAKSLKGYNPTDSEETCRRLVDQATQEDEQVRGGSGEKRG